MNWGSLAVDWSLHDPLFLWLLLLVPLAILLRRTPRPVARAFAPFDFARQLQRSRRQGLRFLPWLLQAFAFALLIVAMARPQQSVQMPVEEQGIDLLLCLDLSSSMAATDLDPSSPTRTRLEVARGAAESFLDTRSQDRIGLVTFARDARLVCPPTLDHRSLRTLLTDLDQVEAGSPEDATGIGVALARSAVFLRDAATSSKVVILLSDGEETVATDPGSAAIHPQDAAALCLAWGIRVYTISAGPAAAATRAGLQKLATTTGGQAFAAVDAAALVQVYAAIDQLERTRFQRLPWVQAERFIPFLLAALVSLVLAVALRRMFWEVQV
ncbi:MAG: VWA domain-containing protein [Planctomycetota bacterium]|jgi:Ca-activated chloride channel family protein